MRKLFVVFAASAFALWATAGYIYAAALLGAISQGSPPAPSGGGGTAPVVASRACTVSSGFTNGQLVQQVHGAGSCSYSATCAGVSCSGANAIISWAITAQSSASAFAITSTSGAGELTGGTNAANVTTGSYTVTVTATNSTGTSPGATQTVNAYADGTPGAPSATVQLPTLLPGGYSSVPAWNAPGVNYAVGIPTGTSLTDWQSISMTGVSVNNTTGQITVSGGTAVTLNAIDFSLHSGAFIFVQNMTANFRVTNSNFGYSGTRPTGPVIDMDTGNTGTMYIGNNVIDSNGSNTTQSVGPSGTIVYSSGGGLTVEYNYLKNMPEDVIQIGVAGAPGGTATWHFNLIRNNGQGTYSPPPHPDWLQMEGSNAMTLNWLFNTYYMDNSLHGSEGVFMDGNSVAGITNFETGYNVMISTTNGSLNAFVAACTTASETGLHCQAGNISGTGNIINNFVDPTNIFYFSYPGTGSGTPPPTINCTGNINMLNGSGESC